jgi:uncharacterized protein YqhQ
MKVGGQAVIEGVMMKSRGIWSVAVRDPRGVIHVRKERLSPIPVALKLPLIRGVLALWQALSLGIRALDYSASKAYDEEDEKPVSQSAMYAAVGFAIVLGAVLFIFLPLYAAKLLGVALPVISRSGVLFNIVEGAVRVFVFIVYLYLISLWGDIRRLFEYHGAEHKVIFAHEAGSDMMPDSIRKFGTLHPRCGTSFVFMVMVVSIIVFSFVPGEWSFPVKFASRLALIPLVAGLSYEMLRFSSVRASNPIVRILIKPGLMLQRITTREPDDAQLEVALSALRAVLPDGKQR